MPNHVNQTLIVFGEETCRFLARVGAELDLSQLVPYPPGYDNLDGAAQCDWCSANWDTKSGAYDVALTLRTSQATFSFCSAWRPPLKALDAAAAMFPGPALFLVWCEPRTQTLHHAYWSSGRRISGEHSYRGGHA